MRIIFIVIVVAFYMLFALPEHAYIRHLAKKNQDAAYEKAYRLVRRFFGTVMFLSGCKYTVKGRENIPDNEAVLFVGNHRSYFDIFCSHNAIGRPVGFMSKVEMKKIPLLSLFMDDIGCTWLDRNDMKSGLDTINKSCDNIKSGHSMMVFPEGTRNKGEGLLEFKDGAFKIAQKAGCLIVPVAICGTDNLMEANKHHMIHAHKVVIEFLPPVDIRGLTPKDRKEKLHAIPDVILAARQKNLPEVENKK